MVEIEQLNHPMIPEKNRQKCFSDVDHSQSRHRALLS